MTTLEQKRSERFHSYEGPLRRACKAVQPQHVLEWGPGDSTAMVVEECPAAQILTIEHELKYANAAAERFKADNVEVVHREISMAGGKSMGYANYPLWRQMQSKSPRKYDLIFVDGRSRFDCLVAARQLVSLNGVVVLHDAHRQNYHPATELFSHVQQYDRLRTWVMSRSPLTMFGETDHIPKPNTVLSVAATLDDLQARFKSGQPFFYTRFGDADLLFIDDENYLGNKRHSRSKELSRELTEAYMINDPSFLIGSVGAGKVFKKLHNDRMKEIASQHHEGRQYHSAVALHSTYVDDPPRFIEFCRKSFHGKRVLMVGGESVCRNELVRATFSVAATIELPDTNAYQMLDSQMARIEKNVAAVGKWDIVICAAGQATRVLAKRLWEKSLRQIQYFDVGSTIDALAERHLRTWIKRNTGQVEIYRREFMPKPINTQQPQDAQQ